MPITVKVSKKTPSTKLPTRATSGAAGYDLYSTVDVIIQPGQTVQIDRIAQIILLAYNKFDLEEVSELSATERGSGGFGSTGR